MALATKRNLAAANAINNRAAASEDMLRARASFTEAMAQLAKKYRSDPR
jgi:hypothetical protein